jgi:hypothetical protein
MSHDLVVFQIVEQHATVSHILVRYSFPIEKEDIKVAQSLHACDQSVAEKALLSTCIIWNGVCIWRTFCRESQTLATILLLAAVASALPLHKGRYAPTPWFYESILSSLASYGLFCIDSRKWTFARFLSSEPATRSVDAIVSISTIPQEDTVAIYTAKNDSHYEVGALCVFFQITAICHVHILYKCMIMLCGCGRSAPERWYLLGVLNDFVKWKLAVSWQDPYTQTCQAGEVNITIVGVDGAICSPACGVLDSCPKDIPKGATAKPTCALQVHMPKIIHALVVVNRCVPATNIHPCSVKRWNPIVSLCERLQKDNPCLNGLGSIFELCQHMCAKKKIGSAEKGTTDRNASEIHHVFICLSMQHIQHRPFCMRAKKQRLQAKRSCGALYA